VYSYTEAEALEIYSALPAARIEAFQSPVKACDHASMKLLTDAGVPVMATEAEYRSEIHEQLITMGAVQFLQTAPVACGGINRLLELSEEVTESGADIELSLEVSSTAIAFLTACHFCASIPSVTHVEYHYIHQVFFEHLDLPPIRDGWLQLSEDAMGLGMQLPEAETQLVFTEKVDA